MKKKVLSIFLLVTLISTSFSPVYGTEFTSSDSAEEVFSTGTEEIGSDDISETENQMEQSSEIPEVNVYDEFPAFYDEESIITKLELIKSPDKTKYTLGEISGDLYHIDISGLTLKVTSSDNKSYESTFEGRLDEDGIEDSDGNEYDCNLLDKDLKKIDFDDYDVWIGPGEYFIQIIYNETVQLMIPISVQIPDTASILTKIADGQYSADAKVYDSGVCGIFVPETSGNYIISMGKYNSYTLFDEYGKEVSGINNNFSLTGGTKYIIYNGYSGEDSMQITAELAYGIASIEPAGGFDQDITYYTPVDFWKDSFNGKYTVSERWNGKIKINYSNGESEIISARNGKTKYGMYVQRYIIYNGNKNYPEAGSYDVHIGVQGSDKEIVIKNVSVKNSSEMPTINNSGTQTITVGSSSAYIRVKTGTETRYVISAAFPQYNQGTQGIAIYKENDGIIDEKNGYAGSVLSGHACALQPNSVYYLSFNLHSGWAGNPTATFTVMPQAASISKCDISLQKTTYPYTGKTIVPAVTIRESNTTLTQGVDYTVTYKNNKNIGTATITVKGKGSYTGSVKKTFKIQLQTPTLKTVNKSGTTDAKLIWKKSANAAGYEVYRATGNSWKKIETVKSTSYINKKLKKGSTYKYKIRAYKIVNGKKVYSGYSAVRSIKR